MREDYDFQTEDYSAIAEEAIANVTSDLEDSEAAAYDERESFFDVDAELATDPIEASQRDGLTLEESTEVMSGLANWKRMTEAHLSMAEGNETISKTALVTERTRLNLAKRDVMTQDVANEGKRLIQSIERGKLTDEKTLGLALQGVTQQVLNAREIDIIRLEMGKTEAVISSRIAEIEAIKSDTETKMLQAREKVMKAAGVNGTYDI